LGAKDGFETFYANHRCNQLCRELKLMKHAKQTQPDDHESSGSVTAAVLAARKAPLTSELFCWCGLPVSTGKAIVTDNNKFQGIPDCRFCSSKYEDVEVKCAHCSKSFKPPLKDRLLFVCWPAAATHCTAANCRAAAFKHDKSLKIVTTFTHGFPML